MAAMMAAGCFLTEPPAVCLDYSRLADPHWCADCGGTRTFIPVEEFPGGWRGYCMGCEQEKYVLFTRTVAA